MPILVQWKWQENYKTFLVIFHFDDDFSRPNLRTRRMTFRGKDHFYQYIPEDLIPSKNHGKLGERKIRTVVTWAPSHVETGLLSEVLTYANIINGLAEGKKRELLKTKPIFFDFSDLKMLPDFDEFREILGDKICTIGFDAVDLVSKTAHFSFCAELCPQYIEYLKKVLTECGK